jgi:hypothetical protein
MNKSSEHSAYNFWFKRVLNYYRKFLFDFMDYLDDGLESRQFEDGGQNVRLFGDRNSLKLDIGSN